MSVELLLRIRLKQSRGGAVSGDGGRVVPLTPADFSYFADAVPKELNLSP